MTTNNQDKAVRLEMVSIDHHRFAVEILHANARINLTQMAKLFGKSYKPANWLRTDEARRYLKAISVSQKCATADLVEVRQGGISEMQGTWCTDRRIAIRFAQWLSPEFSVAVDEDLLRLMLGKAVIAECINGVEPIIHGGRAWYPFADALRSMGLSTRSSAWRRKSAMPEHFCLICGRNFITAQYFRTLLAYNAWKKQYSQLEMVFCDVKPDKMLED